MTPDRDRHAAVERAVRAVALRLLSRETTIVQAVAALAEAVDEARAEIMPRMTTAAVRRARRAEMLAELDRLEQAGRKREAATIVARKFVNRLEPIATESLARKLRRWRCQKNGHVRLKPAG